MIMEHGKIRPGGNVLGLGLGLILVLTAGRAAAVEDGVYVSGKDYPLQDEAADFPNQDRGSNQERIRRESSSEKAENRVYPRDFANQNRPDNRTILRQRAEQAEDLTRHISPGEILITVSGLSEGEVRDFASVLEDDVVWIEEVDPMILDNGLAGFAVHIEGNAKQLSGQLEDQSFGPFRLKLIRFRPEQIDFALD
jgi:hypothetical protein